MNQRGDALKSRMERRPDAGDLESKNILITDPEAYEAERTARREEAAAAVNEVLRRESPQPPEPDAQA